MSQIANGTRTPGNVANAPGDVPGTHGAPGNVSDIPGTYGAPGDSPSAPGSSSGNQGYGHVNQGRTTADEAKPLAISKNLEALSAHYKNAYCHLYRDALSIVSSPETAAEVVQDAYADTTAKINAGYEIRHLGAWFRTVVRNLALQRREEKFTVPLPEDLSSDRSNAPADIAYARQKCRELYRTVEQLGAAQRSAFILAELHGLNYREIAKTMDRTEDSIRSLLARARKQVRETLGTDASFLTAPLVQLDAVQGLAHNRTGGLRDYVAARLSDVQASVTSLLQRSAAAVAQPAEALIAGALVVAVLNGVPADQLAPADAGAPVAAETAPSTGTDTSRKRGVSPAREPAIQKLPPADNELLPPNSNTDKSANDELQPEPRGKQSSDEPAGKQASGPSDSYSGSGAPANGSGEETGEEGADIGHGPPAQAYECNDHPPHRPPGHRHPKHPEDCSSVGFPDSPTTLEDPPVEPPAGPRVDPVAYPAADSALNIGNVNRQGAGDAKPPPMPAGTVPSRGEVGAPGEDGGTSPPLAEVARSPEPVVDPSHDAAESQATAATAPSAGAAVPTKPRS